MADKPAKWAAEREVGFKHDSGYSNNIDDRLRGMLGEILAELYGSCGVGAKGRCDYSCLPEFAQTNKIKIRVSIER